MPKTITRAMLADAASIATGVHKADVARIGERMFELLGEALAGKETVKLTNFGSLQVRPRMERIGRNPRTGEEHAITARHTIVFKPGRDLEGALREHAVSIAAAEGVDIKPRG